MRKPIKYVEKAAVAAAKATWVVFDSMNRIKPEPVADSEMVRQAAAQVVREVQASARLAAHHGLALPEVCSRNPPADS